MFICVCVSVCLHVRVCLAAYKDTKLQQIQRTPGSVANWPKAWPTYVKIRKLLPISINCASSQVDPESWRLPCLLGRIPTLYHNLLLSIWLSTLGCHSFPLDWEPQIILKVVRLPTAPRYRRAERINWTTSHAEEWWKLEESIEPLTGLLML